MTNFRVHIFVFAFFAAIIPAFGSPITLAWEDLVPKKGEGKAILVSPEQETVGLPDRKTFDGNDEDYNYLVESLEQLRYQQPPGAFIDPKLDGKEVKIPGYITPLAFTEQKLKEFLLVPYHGACIHFPPPPGNQIIFVEQATGIDEERLYQPVWITGTLRANAIGTAVADVGYSIENAKAERYDEVNEN